MLRTLDHLRGLEIVCEEGSVGRLEGADMLLGYNVDALDGTVGRLYDYLVEEQDWTIRYLCISRRIWLPGRRKVVPAEWVHLVNWKHRLISLRRYGEEIRKSPDYLGPGSFSPEYSLSLESYYAGSGWKAGGAV